jgi:hypothetical protein
MAHLYFIVSVVVVHHESITHCETAVAAQCALQDSLWIADVQEICNCGGFANMPDPPEQQEVQQQQQEVQQQQQQHRESRA